MLLDEITITHPTNGDLTISRRLSEEAGGLLLDTVDADPPKRRLYTQDLDYTVGGLVIPGRTTERTVRITGWVIGDTRQHAAWMRRRLSTWCADTGRQPLTLRWAPDTDPELGVMELTVHAAESPVTYTTEDALVLAFTVEFVAVDPVAYFVEPAQVRTVTVAEPAWIAGESDTDLWPEITVYGPTSGTTTGFTLTNTVTGKTLGLTGLSLTSGETITIVTRPGREEILEDGVNRMANRTTGSRFWPLVPDMSRVELAVTGGSGVVAEFTWRRGRLNW